MRRLRVDIPRRGYDICIGAGLLKDSGSLIREIYSGKTAAVVTDGNVYSLYYHKLAEALRGAGIEPDVTVIEPGEASKSAACLSALYDALLGMDITRGGLIIALGGGVAGDLAGYAAATLLRGIPYVQIPTTLLAQADSGVGGKVAINHPKGKNLIGAFYQPKMVIADTDCLKTLDSRVFADGMAEVIKHGAIADKSLLSALERKDYDIVDVVARSYDIKRSVVERDEFDTGLRMTLNFGHTFGHAIEKYYNYGTYTHGEAVSIGMVMACALGERLRITKLGTKERMAQILASYNLPVCAPVAPKELYMSMLLDKKRGGSNINLILLNEIGSCLIHQVDIKKLEESL